MSSHVALLRGVNVGGRGLVVMADLRCFFESHGCRNVQTVLQSGNVVFEAKQVDVPRLESLLEKETVRQFGGPIDFFLRTAEEWRSILDTNPYPEEAKRDPGHLLIMCMKSAAKRDAIDGLRKFITGREYLDSRGRELYIVYPDGIGRSRFTGALIENKLGVRGTARNWNTAQKIAALLSPST